MSNIQTGAERMPHDLSHLGFLAGQIGRLRSEERFSRNAETDLVCRLLLEKKNKKFDAVIINCNFNGCFYVIITMNKSIKKSFSNGFFWDFKSLFTLW